MQTTAEQKPSVTFTIPSWILAITKVVDYGANAVKSTVETVEEKVSERPSFSKFNLRGKLPKLPKIKFPKTNLTLLNTIKEHKKIVAVVVALLLIGGFVTYKYSKNNGSIQATGNALGINSSSDSIVALNRRFEVPIKNKDGSETGEKLGITITNIEKTKNILIQNAPAKTKDGKTFLILSIEIQNDTKKQLTVRPVDMVRLVGTDGRTYAPDVHNNEVSAEPVSLKKTRVGYVVDEGQKSFKLLIGEVRGKQDTIEVGF